MQRLKKRLGFIVANDAEEFLAHYDENALLWSATPELAKVYPSRKKAENVVLELEYKTRLWVLSLFEHKHQLIVGSDSDERPQWL
jgi:hypothetical protein